MTRPEQSEAPKAPRPPVVPPARAAAPESAPRAGGADAAASAGRPSGPGAPTPPANPSAPVVPVVDAPDQVAVLQTVVEKLATPTTKAAATPRSGYTPRVFAFDRPPKWTPGSGSSGNQAARPQDTTTPGTTPALSTAGQAPHVTDPNKTPDETADAATAVSASDGATPEARSADAAAEPTAPKTAPEAAAPAKAAPESAAPRSTEPVKAPEQAEPVKAAPKPAEPANAANESAAPAKAEPIPTAAGSAAPTGSSAPTGAGAAPAAGAAATAAAAGTAAAASSAAVPAPPVAPAPPPVAPAPPSVPPRSLIPPSGAVPPPGPGTVPAPNPGQNSFLKPLTGAIQRVSRPLAGTRWAPVRPDATPLAASEQGPAGPNGPGTPGGPAGPHGPAGPNVPGGPNPADQGGFFGLAGDGAPSRGPKIALFAVLAAVLLFGIYVLVAWTQSDTVPTETTVAGVDVGGMTQAEAASALTEQLAPRVKEPIALTAGEGKAQLSPEPSGLAIDADATVAELTGFSLSPMRMWAHMFGGSEQELVLNIDDKKFDAAVAGLEDSLAVDPVDGTVAFVDGQAVKTDPKEGSRIVASETARIIKERWVNEESPFELPVEPVAPTISQQETDENFAVAQKVVSGPVTVSVGDQTPVLPTEVLAGLIRFEQRDDKLAIIVDKDATVQAIVDGTTNLLEVPDDAHFEFVGGRPTVVEGKTGTTLDAAEAAKAVRIAATSDDRETSVELVEQDPEETVQSLKKLGVKEVVSEFSTPLTNEPVRTQNLVRGAQMITGDLIKPGETFSLLEALAPITLENGYFDAGVVEDGKHVEAVGGGLSQMATTSFNAGFFAGFEDIEHHAHSYWFPRYPPGREATIYVGAKDMKFTNDTPYGAVMQSFVSGGELTVRIWSTKYYTVQESTSPKRNIVPKTTIRDSSADCEPYPGGEDGFSVTISRKVLRDGQVVKENSFNHSYNPDNPVVCE
ncbi:VanW family protein [Promicromonospora panici]|uniref:VanW family protein n=1 Tax=Promicromonospora panici TaxID=2219658 RepID=UPI00101D1529|nr:VanW family protein [Promicromonospora panici]